MLDSQKRKIVLSIGLFALFFLMMCAYRHIGIFTDEADNVLGGMVVANGGIVYRDFYSQHTPLMYYICGLFKVLGANGIVEMRIYCYVLLSVIWVAMFFRYTPYFGKITLIGYSIFYIISLTFIDNVTGHMVLSEQFEAQALVVLFLEFLMYFKHRTINYSNAICISLAVFTAIGTAFMSILAVLAIILAVLVMEIRTNIMERMTFLKGFFRILKKFWILILIILAPFIISAAYYLSNNMLENVYEQAIYLNLKIYSLFTGAQAPGILNAIKQIFTSYFSLFEGTVNSLFENPFTSIRILFNFLINIFFIVYIYKKDRLVSVFIFIFVIAVGARGYTGFHSIPYWAITEMMTLILMKSYIIENKKNMNMNMKWKKETYDKVLGVMLFFIIITPYMKVFPYVVPEKKDFFGEQTIENTASYYIQKLTDQNDKIQISSVGSNMLYIENNRFPASKHMYAYTPWFTLAYDDKIVDELEETKPKIVQYADNLEVWGYNITEYAPGYCEYIKSNYTLINSDLQLWVRNDFYDEAIEILEMKNNNSEYDQGVV